MQLWIFSLCITSGLGLTNSHTIKQRHVQSSRPSPEPSQVEHGAWLAADVALHGPVPAQSRADEPRQALPGVTLQGWAGCRLPAEARGDAEVRLKGKCLYECLSHTRGFEYSACVCVCVCLKHQ